MTKTLFTCIVVKYDLYHILRGEKSVNVFTLTYNFERIMSVIFILISASLTIAIGFLVAFIWSVKSGQYDDDYTPSIRMLFEDNPKKEIIENEQHNN